MYALFFLFGLLYIGTCHVTFLVASHEGNAVYLLGKYIETTHIVLYASYMCYTVFDALIPCLN